MKKHLILLAKIAFALFALYVVFRKADMREVWDHLQSANPLYIFLSFMILNMAQMVSAIRMQFYFAEAGLKCSALFSIALYYVGMFFNTILPGGIGGDGYKIYVMSKWASFSKLTCLRLMLSNRANGLFILMLLTLLLAVFSTLPPRIPHFYPLLTLGFLILLPGYFLSVKWLLKERVSTALSAAKYSFIVQGCCVLSALALFTGMGLLAVDTKTYADYLILFLISSIVSILPVSIGGAGLREVTFLYGTSYLGLDAEFGVAFSLIYFAINTLLSLLGLPFLSNLKKIYDEQI